MENNFIRERESKSGENCTKEDMIEKSRNGREEKEGDKDSSYRN